MSAAHRIADRHIRHFDNWYQPSREAVLAAINEAILMSPPERFSLEELTHEIRCHLSGRKTRIWSGRHQAWWRPDAAGYTDSRTAAGLYDFGAAWRAVKECGPDEKIALEVAG